MLSKKFLIVALAMALGALSGCMTTGTGCDPLKGALVGGIAGGATGAGVGVAAGDPLVGALIGLPTGAVMGGGYCFVQKQQLQDPFRREKLSGIRRDNSASCHEIAARDLEMARSAQDMGVGINDLRAYVDKVFVDYQECRDMASSAQPGAAR